MPVDKKKQTTASKNNTATSPIPEAEPLRPKNFHQYLRAEIRQTTRTVMEEIMREELSQFLGAAWGASTAQRKGYRNGFYSREPLDERRSYRRPHGPARSRRGVPHAPL